MPASVPLMIAALPLLLLASAFFSGSETALFSLTRHQRARLSRSAAFADQAVARMLAETRGLLITLLLGNMTINVLFFVISSMLLIELRRSGAHAGVLTVASIAPLLLIILFGEVLPKLLAARLSLRWSQLAGPVLWLVHRVLGPVRLVTSLLIITPLARLIAPPERPPDLSAEEFSALLELSQRHGVIDPGEEQLLVQALELSQLQVQDLMVPRVDMHAYNLADDPAELYRLIRETRLRHVPVYHGSLDHVIGLAYARQVLLRRPKTRQEVTKLIRQVKFVPEIQRADQFLIELRKTGQTFAIAVDEYGGTAGLITIEDVVERLVGDIPGDYEPVSEPEVEKLGPGRWRVSADLAIRDWAQMFGPSPGIEAVSTLGGLVMAHLGRRAHPGDEVQLANVRLRVEHMEAARIDTLLIELQSEREQQEGRP